MIGFVTYNNFGAKRGGQVTKPYVLVIAFMVAYLVALASFSAVPCVNNSLICRVWPASSWPCDTTHYCESSCIYIIKYRTQHDLHPSVIVILWWVQVHVHAKVCATK